MTVKFYYYSRWTGNFYMKWNSTAAVSFGAAVKPFVERGGECTNHVLTFFFCLHCGGCKLSAWLWAAKTVRKKSFTAVSQSSELLIPATATAAACRLRNKNSCLGRCRRKFNIRFPANLMNVTKFPPSSRRSPFGAPVMMHAKTADITHRKKTALAKLVAPQKLYFQFHTMQNPEFRVSKDGSWYHKPTFCFFMQISL